MNTLPDIASMPSNVPSDTPAYRPRPRKNRKNRQTLEARLLVLASQLAENSRTLKELAEDVRKSQDTLIQKVREQILDQ